MANFINSLYLLVKKPGRNNKIFTKLLTKVSIIWFMTGFHIAAMDNVNKQQYEVEIKQDYYMIKSEISTVMYQELAEVHGTTEIQNQIEYIDNNLGLIKGLSGYHRDNKNCEHIGNHETDDLKEIINLIKNLPFTNYRLFIREKSDLEKYMVILKRMKVQSKCVMGHSKFSISYYLAVNTYRQDPVTYNQGNNYRKFIYKYYENQNKDKCIRHGGYDNKYYALKIKVEEPALETCSAICYNMKKMFNLNNNYKEIIADFNITTMNCAVWTYDIHTKTCKIIQEINKNDYYGKISWKRDRYEIFSGTYACQPRRFFDTRPEILLNGKYIELQSICIFSTENIVYGMYHTRCMGLYRLLETNLKYWKQHLGSFWESFKNMHQLSHNIYRRDLSTLPKILISELAKTAVKTGIDIINSVVGRVNRGEDGLKKLNENIRKGGVTAKVISNIQNYTGIATATNIDRMISIDTSLGRNLIQLEKNYNKFINDLNNRSNQIMEYYTSLVWENLPLNTDTKFFLNNKHQYIFMSYMTRNNKIIRQFIKKTMSDVPSEMITIIPREKHFYEAEYWQSEIVTETDGMSECMNQLLTDRIKENEQNHCSQMTTNRKVKYKDIYYARQVFGQISGKILIVKQKGLLEITCIKHRLMEKLLGTALIIITNNCKVKIDGKSIFKKENDKEGFAPKVMYNNNTFEVQTQEINDTQINTIVIGVLAFSITIIGLIFVKTKLGKKKLEKGKSMERHNSIEGMALTQNTHQERQGETLEN